MTTNWVGSAPGGYYVWRTTGADKSTGATWAGITGNLITNEISGLYQASSITVDPTTANKVYLTTEGCLPAIGSTPPCDPLYKATANGSSTHWLAADGFVNGGNLSEIRGPPIKYSLITPTQPATAC